MAAASSGTTRPVPYWIRRRDPPRDIRVEPRDLRATRGQARGQPAGETTDRLARRRGGKRAGGERVAEGDVARERRDLQAHLALRPVLRRRQMPVPAHQIALAHRRVLSQAADGDGKGHGGRQADRDVGGGDVCLRSAGQGRLVGAGKQRPPGAQQQDVVDRVAGLDVRKDDSANAPVAETREIVAARGQRAVEHRIGCYSEHGSVRLACVGLQQGRALEAAAEAEALIRRHPCRSIGIHPDIPALPLLPGAVGRDMQRRSERTVPDRGRVIGLRGERRQEKGRA